MTCPFGVKRRGAAVLRQTPRASYRFASPFWWSAVSQIEGDSAQDRGGNCVTCHQRFLGEVHKCSDKLILFPMSLFPRAGFLAVWNTEFQILKRGNYFHVISLVSDSFFFQFELKLNQRQWKYFSPQQLGFKLSIFSIKSLREQLLMILYANALLQNGCRRTIPVIICKIKTK